MKKLSYEYVKSQIKKSGYKLLSKEYENVKTKMEIECPNDHIYEIVYNNFQQGHRCPICYGNKKHSYEFIKSQIEKEGYKLLSKKYEGALFKLKVECNKGHQYSVTYDNFRIGKRCPICYGGIKLTYNYVKSQFAKYGYKLLSNNYKNNNVKLRVECDKGHQYSVIYNSFQQGDRCPICNDITNHSRSEKACVNVIKQMTDKNVIENDRTQIINPKTGYNLELDIYIPELNKAVEFNGEYWHRSDYSKYKDNQKIEQCKEKSIDLLVIKFQDWIDNRQIQINNLKEFIG